MKIWVYDPNFRNYYFYHYNDILSLCMQLKLIYLLSYIFSKSDFGSQRAYRVCNMFGKKLTNRFVLKCLLKDQPFKSMMVALFGGIFFFSWAKILVESPIDRLNVRD